MRFGGEVDRSLSTVDSVSMNRDNRDRRVCRHPFGSIEWGLTASRLDPVVVSRSDTGFVSSTRVSILSGPVPSLIPAVSLILSCSLCGSGGASLGGSGLFSVRSPVCPSWALRCRSFSLTPPSVPVVPCFGVCRLGSSMTPSLTLGMAGVTKGRGDGFRPAGSSLPLFSSVPST